MDADELDIAIAELETRVDRLRALYEQYFLGIERLEPLIARKDVDRRIWQLKREKIRNTAKRFKLQTIIQRYNTLQQYWQRICREIERGTYRRHVLRAERATTTVSDIVAQKEAEKRAQAEARTTADDLADMLARDVDAEQEFARAVAEASAQLDVGSKPPSPRPTPFEALDLELEGIPATHPPPAAASALAKPSVSAASSEQRGNLLAALGTRSGSGRSSVASLVGPTPVRQGRLRPRSAAAPTAAGVPPASAPTAAARSVAAPDVRLGASPAGAGRPPAMASPLATAGSPPAARPPAPRANPVAAPPAAEPSAAAAPRRENPAPRAQPEPARQGLTDQRILELHRDLVAAKQRIKETGKVSVQGLAKSLRAAESKLRAQHKDRRIEFDIVIKNGKAVVKPTVR